MVAVPLLPERSSFSTCACMFFKATTDSIPAGNAAVLLVLHAICSRPMAFHAAIFNASACPMCRYVVQPKAKNITRIVTARFMKNLLTLVDAMCEAWFGTESQVPENRTE